MPLTDTAVKKAKPGDKPVKLSDAKGLYLLAIRWAQSCGAGSTGCSAKKKSWL